MFLGFFTDTQDRQYSVWFVALADAKIIPTGLLNF